MNDRGYASSKPPAWEHETMQFERASLKPSTWDLIRLYSAANKFLSDTIHSRARSEVTEAQLHEADFLLECVLIRDGQAALPCWFPRSDIQLVVNYICTM